MTAQRTRRGDLRAALRRGRGALGLEADAADAWSTRSLTTAIFVHGMNKGWKRMARQRVAEDCQRFGKIYARHELDPRLRQAFTMMGT